MPASTFFRTASLWLKIAVICMALGLLLFVIGFATVSWKTWETRKDSQSNGLWGFKHCPWSGQCSEGSYGTTNDFHRAIQAMECIGLIGFFLAILTLLLYLCADSCRRRDFLQADTVFTFVGVLFACIGFAMAASSSPDNRLLGYHNVGWSMGIAIAGAILYGIAGIMLLLQLLGC